jgi:hypothetical protein
MVNDEMTLAQAFYHKNIKAYAIKLLGYWTFMRSNPVHFALNDRTSEAVLKSKLNSAIAFR